MLQSPLKAEKFWAEMRSTAYLFNKSQFTKPEQRARLMDELGVILGKRILTYPPTLAEFGIGADTPYRVKKEILDRIYDTKPPEPSEIRFMTFMANKAVLGQKANWTWRITQEAEQKQKDGWYPFFVTLTVDPKMCMGQVHEFKDSHGKVARLVSYDSPQDLWTTGREFRLYIRSLARVVAAELKHPPPHKAESRNGVDYGYRPESDYVTYAGVLEHGKTNEHHHAHIMVWLREIPSSWKIDPNHGRLPVNCTERECRQLRRYWPWAIASQKPALYFRTKGDIWSELGHVTPVDGRKKVDGKDNKQFGQPIKINQVEAVGNYVTKYMQKGTKQWHHRMKCTRNLGLQKIKRLIKTLDNKTLEWLSWKPQESSHLLSVNSIHSVPQGLIRSIAKQQIFSRQWEENQLVLMNLMKTNYDHYSKMLRSVRDGARPDRMPSHQFYDWVQSHLPEINEYSETRLIEAHEKLRDHFPKPLIRVTPITPAGKHIGFTQCI